MAIIKASYKGLEIEGECKSTDIITRLRAINELRLKLVTMFEKVEKLTPEQRQTVLKELDITERKEVK